MKAKIQICKDHQEASRFAASLLAERFIQNPKMAVAFAAGDTPLACYRELIHKQRNRELRLDQAFYIGLDEWMGLGSQAKGGCMATLNQAYYLPAGIPAERVMSFNGLCVDTNAELGRMREILKRYPLTLAVLGVGVNGHVGFNEPGEALLDDFSLARLSESTRTIGLKYFSGCQVPALGATITLQALKRAEHVIVLATGSAKRDAVSDVLSGRACLPVGAFLEHPGCFYVFDEEAAR